MRFLTIALFGSMLGALFAALLLVSCGMFFLWGDQHWIQQEIAAVWLVASPVLLVLVPLVIAGYVRMWRPRLR